MGFFSRYSDSDRINHIGLIIMAYESGAVLDIERYPKGVGPYWIEYEYIKEQGNSAVRRYLESHASEYEQKRSLSSLEQRKNIEVTGSGKLFYGDANELLKPLFLKIRELEEEIKLL